VIRDCFGHPSNNHHTYHESVSKQLTKDTTWTVKDCIIIPEFLPLSKSILAKVGNLITNFQIRFDQYNNTNLSKIAKEEMFFIFFETANISLIKTWYKILIIPRLP